MKSVSLAARVGHSSPPAPSKSSVVSLMKIQTFFGSLFVLKLLEIAHFGHISCDSPQTWYQCFVSTVQCPTKIYYLSRAKLNYKTHDKNDPQLLIVEIIKSWTKVNINFLFVFSYFLDILCSKYMHRWLTWRRHLILSPGAITMVDITPDNAPAAASWPGPSTSSGVFCCNLLPIALPRKQMAKMGEVATRGAPMPANIYFLEFVNEVTNVSLTWIFVQRQIFVSETILRCDERYDVRSSRFSSSLIIKIPSL